MWRSFSLGRALVPLTVTSLVVVFVVVVVFAWPTHLAGPQSSSGRNGLIAFTDETQEAGSDSFDIFTMRADGSGRHQVTHTGRAGAPAWSPDGRQILYVNTTGFGDDGTPLTDIWIMDADGSNQHSLVSGPTAADPAWSPDGLHFVFTRGVEGESSQLFEYSFDTKNVRQLTDPDTWRYAAAGSWSPDGDLIAFAGVLAAEAPGNGDLFTVRVDGTGRHRLTATPQLAETSPDWAPDGRRLVCEVWDYRPPNEDEVSPQIRVLGRTGTHPRVLQKYSVGAPAWSPDGRWITTSGIRVVAADGSTARNLSRGDGPDWGAAPAP